MRYGHQGWADLQMMTCDELHVMADEIMEMVKQENESNANVEGS